MVPGQRGKRQRLASRTCSATKKVEERGGGWVGLWHQRDAFKLEEAAELVGAVVDIFAVGGRGKIADVGFWRLAIFLLWRVELQIVRQEELGDRCDAHGRFLGLHWLGRGFLLPHVLWHLCFARPSNATSSNQNSSFRDRYRGQTDKARHPTQVHCSEIPPHCD